MTTIDFGKALRDAKTASYEALPSGDYEVEVAQADSVRASSGKPMIKAQMKVLQGPYQDRRVFNNFVLSLENPQAMAIWFRHMRSFGLSEEFFAQLGGGGSMEAVATALVGRRARLTLGQRDWQGETRNEVTAVKPYTGAPAAGGGPLQLPGHTPMTGPAPVAPPAPPPVAYAPPQPTYAAPVAAQPVAVAPTAQPAPAPAPAQVATPATPVDVVVVPAAVPTAGPVAVAASPPTSLTSPTSEQVYAAPPLVTPPPQPTAPPEPPAAPQLPI